MVEVNVEGKCRVRGLIKDKGKKIKDKRRVRDS
jgi:hypothetical protein